MAFQRPFLISLRREDSREPWGFRLKGGGDVAEPVVVQQVLERSLAEKSGLRDGDELIQVGRINVQNLGLSEIHNLVIQCKDRVEMFVIREDLLRNRKENEPLTVKAVTHSSYNSPFQLYSADNVADTLATQTTILTDPKAPLNHLGPTSPPIVPHSDILKFIREADHKEHIVNGDLAPNPPRPKQPPPVPPKPGAARVHPPSFQPSPQTPQYAGRPPGKTEQLQYENYATYHQEKRTAHRTDSYEYEAPSYQPSYQQPQESRTEVQKTFRSQTSFTPQQDTFKSEQSFRPQASDLSQQQIHTQTTLQQTSRQQEYQQQIEEQRIHQLQEQRQAQIREQERQQELFRQRQAQIREQEVRERQQREVQERQRQQQAQQQAHQQATQRQSQDTYEQQQRQRAIEEQRQAQLRSQQAFEQQQRQQQALEQQKRQQQATEQQQRQQQAIEQQKRQQQALEQQQWQQQTFEQRQTQIQRERYEKQQRERQALEQQQQRQVRQQAKVQQQVSWRQNHFDDTAAQKKLTSTSRMAPSPLGSPVVHRRNGNAPSWPPKNSSVRELPKTGFSPSFVKERGSKEFVWPPVNPYESPLIGEGAGMPMGHGAAANSWHPQESAPSRSLVPRSPTPTRRCKDVPWPPAHSIHQDPLRPVPRPVARRGRFDNYIVQQSSSNVPPTYRLPPGTTHIEIA